MDPKLNLTGKPFNFDLDPKAAQHVLDTQSSKNEGQGGYKLKRLQFISTEAGKNLKFTVKDLARIPGEENFDNQLRLRAAAYGIESHRADPIEFLLKFASELCAGHDDTVVMCPDLVAFLAAYAPWFSDKFQDKSLLNPKYMQKHGVFTNEKVEGWKENDRVELWMPNKKDPYTLSRDDFVTAIQDLVNWKFQRAV